MTGRIIAQRTAPCATHNAASKQVYGSHRKLRCGSHRRSIDRPWIATARHGKVRRAMIPTRFGLVLLLAASCCGTSGAAEPPKAAVFDLELVDMSQEGERGERADQTARIALASAELRRLLADSGQLQVVDLTSRAARIQDRSPLSKCNGCVEDLAREAGADLAVSGIVQKTSNLILSFVVEVREVNSGRRVRAGEVDMRGNTEETRLRGVRWIVKNRLSADTLPGRG